MDQEPTDVLFNNFNEREIRLIRNCLEYAQADPAGLPAHNLMIIVDRLAGLLGFTHKAIVEALDAVAEIE